MEERGRVFVVAGPSGAGKDTLIRKALEMAENIHYSVSATTRPPREGEVEGRDYYFLSESEFDRLVAQGALLEWEEVFGNRYGTLKREVEKAAAYGQNVLLELDVEGALNVKSKIKDAVLIFIMPPSLKELESRLEKRKKDKESDIKLRTDIAPREIEVGRTKFDFIIVNDDVDRAAEEFASVLRGERA
ncbi:MAG: guanylate kinase [Actinobacteria bacterium]|nr:guanylate kinase [Actinomycetota bacterium]